MAYVTWNLNALKDYHQSLFHRHNQLLDFRPVQVDPEEDPFTVEEVCSAITKQRSGGIVGPDGISADMLKAARDILSRWLTIFYNIIQVTAHCPNDICCGIMANIVWVTP